MSKLTKKTIYLLIAAAVILSTAVEALYLTMKGESIVEAQTGFDIIFGFVGAWILILFAKKLLAPLMQKDEQYYGGDDDE